MAEAPEEIFAVDFAILAREIAMDIFEVPQILELHRLTDEEWGRIQAHPKFVAMLANMQAEWRSAENTKERVRVKAQTGLESQLETFITDLTDSRIPLNQRVEAGKFLARLGELDGNANSAGPGEKFNITLNIGFNSKTLEVTVPSAPVPLKTVEHVAE